MPEEDRIDIVQQDLPKNTSTDEADEQMPLPVDNADGKLKEVSLEKPKGIGKTQGQGQSQSQVYNSGLTDNIPKIESAPSDHKTAENPAICAAVKEEDEVNMEVTLTDTPKSDTTIQEISIKKIMKILTMKLDTSTKDVENIDKPELDSITNKNDKRRDN
mmetsp:Transcript_25917/g.39723  ORF Transcript_25917/g.39723 Transcript_25917/m.39723 type:complete len:160 (+) Transcript_25917:226-705(+)